MEGQELEDKAKQFETIACNMLMTCYECSQYRTLFIMIQSIPAFGGFSCLQLAFDGKCLDFFSLDPVQVGTTWVPLAFFVIITITSVFIFTHHCNCSLVPCGALHAGPWCRTVNGVGL